MAMPQLNAKLSTSISSTGIMSAATFTLYSLYAGVAFVQTGSAWGKERLKEFRNNGAQFVPARGPDKLQGFGLEAIAVSRRIYF